MTPEEAKRLDHFFCEGCSSEGQKKLQNSHNATRNSDTKVILLIEVLIVIVDSILHAHLVDI